MNDDSPRFDSSGNYLVESAAENADLTSRASFRVINNHEEQNFTI